MKKQPKSNAKWQRDARFPTPITIKGGDREAIIQAACITEKQFKEDSFLSDKLIAKVEAILWLYKKSSIQFDLHGERPRPAAIKAIAESLAAKANALRLDIESLDDAVRSEANGVYLHLEIGALGESVRPNLNGVNLRRDRSLLRKFDELTTGLIEQLIDFSAVMSVAAERNAEDSRGAPRINEARTIAKEKLACLFKEFSPNESDENRNQFIARCMRQPPPKKESVNHSIK